MPNAAYASEGEEILHPKRLHLFRRRRHVSYILSDADILSCTDILRYILVSVAFIPRYVLVATFFAVIKIGILFFECSRYSRR